MAFIEIFLFAFVSYLFSFWYIQSDDTIMSWHGDTITLLSKSGVPYVDDQTLGLMRLFMGLFVWYIDYLVYSEKDISIDIVVPNEDKPLTVNLKGLERFAPFTMFNWNLLGIYFTIAAGFSLSSSIESLAWLQHYDSVATAAVVMFELGFSLSFLTSYCVSYLIIPEMKRKKASLKSILDFKTLACHNANILFVAVDMVLGRVLFSPRHSVFIALWVTSYVSFSLVWYQFKGYFFYDFLDYRQKNTFLIHVGLLAFVLGLYYFGYFISFLKEMNVIVSFLVSAHWSNYCQ